MRLKPSLLNLTKAELSDLRSLYDLKNISHLNKADLVDRMVKLLPARFSMMLERIGQAAYDILHTMVTGYRLPSLQPQAAHGCLHPRFP
jgi:hypothetical protein